MASGSHKPVLPAAAVQGRTPFKSLWHTHRGTHRHDHLGGCDAPPSGHGRPPGNGQGRPFPLQSPGGAPRGRDVLITLRPRGREGHPQQRASPQELRGVRPGRGAVHGRGLLPAERDPRRPEPTLLPLHHPAEEHGGLDPVLPAAEPPQDVLAEAPPEVRSRRHLQVGARVRGRRGQRMIIVSNQSNADHMKLC